MARGAYGIGGKSTKKWGYDSLVRGWVYLWSYSCFRLSEQPQRLLSSGQSACEIVTGALKGKTLIMLFGRATGKDRIKHSAEKRRSTLS